MRSTSSGAQQYLVKVVRESVSDFENPAAVESSRQVLE
jgi:hypothetical protein